jgi:hypothetical protein
VAQGVEPSKCEALNSKASTTKEKRKRKKPQKTWIIDVMEPVRKKSFKFLLSKIIVPYTLSSLFLSLIKKKSN